MAVVYIKSEFGVKREHITFETEEEALNYCRNLGWQLTDINGFVWKMWYEVLA